jgi:hypothetical protein
MSNRQQFQTRDVAVSRDSLGIVSYRASDDLHAQARSRKEDVSIALIDADRTGWSFGSGDMQYEPNWLPWRATSHRAYAVAHAVTLGLP